MKAQIDDFDKIAELSYIRGPQDQRALYVNKAWSECNYRTWKSPVISMIYRPSARGFYPAAFKSYLTVNVFWKIFYSGKLIAFIKCAI